MMSKKPVITDPFQPKITRNDRFAQMSHQEKVIEQKKKEIQAKLEAKQKTVEPTAKRASPTPKATKPIPTKKPDLKKSGFNLFSNDGSFLDTFKQLKDKKMDSKLKSFKAKESYEQRNKNSRWSQRRRSPSPKERSKARISRFSEKINTFEPKITINTSFNNVISHFDSPQISISPQNVTGQPLLKNIPPPGVIFPTASQSNVITAPPLLLNVPPPQIVQSQVLIPANTNVLVSTSTVNVIPASGILATVTQDLELSSIPPPNPIQVQNIPQPDPINTLNIPHPAPIQVQNIPTPQSIQLNEIPNPKPLDLLAIPTPNEEKAISDPDFIKNIPPPNKSIPPPSLETNVSLPPPQMMPVSIPPPQNIAPCQNILVHSIPPPQLQSIQGLSSQMQGVPPPNGGPFGAAISVALAASPVGNGPIPSLMAQPILPPPGMGVTTVNVSCPPPMLPSMPPPSFVNQPPPMTSQMPPMNVPPPSTAMGMMGAVPLAPPFRDSNAVFPPGTSDYEAMASLGRMVAQCGQGIEDVVRQRKTQDPNLWFLFHKDSAAYQQYLQLIEQFQRELKQESNQDSYKPEDIYEPEMAIEDDSDPGTSIKRDSYSLNDFDFGAKRKRKSRWGDQNLSVLPPTVIMPKVAMGAVAGSSGTLPQMSATNSGVVLSKITRTDPGLIQYTMNTYGSTNLSEEDWKKAEDHYKINLLYQDMVKKRQELEKLQQAGKNKYDYDSDEEVDGGTWEHKLRDKEMMATQLWAQELTRQAEGKHHIGDFLPPEELNRFMEKSNACKEGRMPNFSDYKEFKIKEDNIGFKMLQKLGWSQGQGLGSNGGGIVDPVNKAASREQNQGLGLGDDDSDKEDEYEAYRKRMMLAYRFRPNPLNNPRRPYY